MSEEEYERLGLEGARPRRPFDEGERVLRAGSAYQVLSNEGHYGRVRGSDGKEHYPFFWFHEKEWCRREGGDD
jgi:hypothetical protein